MVTHLAIGNTIDNIMIVRNVLFSVPLSRTSLFIIVLSLVMLMSTGCLSWNIFIYNSAESCPVDVNRLSYLEHIYL